eukprot:CAMPEP_0201520316 /NCGR_PEP_ID=MMETSP0161_2-20130828/10639_1 /ASSEMBLY_ACC=CAM_ASM_000251 /TAXON_ID=180227 /ORGANISM="Neoparamoeba aestuarina, Strain SoJaBio B1-5/56/2" /LENGTH=272 /DNA_ID=CAMNT_0047918635 /DNA_START=139 /DNA_END=957 /DNA_ORIENTATION=-
MTQQVVLLAAASLATVTCSLFFAIIAVLLAIGSVLLMMSSVVVLGNQTEGAPPLPQLPETLQQVIDTIIDYTKFADAPASSSPQKENEAPESMCTGFGVPKQEKKEKKKEVKKEVNKEEKKKENTKRRGLVNEKVGKKTKEEKEKKEKAKEKKELERKKEKKEQERKLEKVKEKKARRDETRTQEILVSTLGWKRKMNFDYHLFTPSTDPSFNTRSLKQLMRQNTPLAASLHELSLTYIDDEGDKVFISSDVELKEALWLSSTTPDILFTLE